VVASPRTLILLQRWTRIWSCQLREAVLKNLEMHLDFPRIRLSSRPKAILHQVGEYRPQTSILSEAHKVSLHVHRQATDVQIDGPGKAMIKHFAGSVSAIGALADLEA
jgi:uncharacterized protein YcbK (DUF882 family)